ncbi:MAG TPA: transglycosylase SLT domain-containing protein [Longimicrobiaceae bacterium]|nr:transglycosylase SLT domain-containing protein [Longimicrobiaceae bacterium]
MEFRSALPVAVLFGSVIGAAIVGISDPKTGVAPAAKVSAATPALVSEAAAATVAAASWDIPVVRNAPVERFIDIFTRKQSDRMALYLKRSGRYEGMIRAKLRERGMPEDLVYLSMIESGFNPTARSKAQAVGLWQFIEETGERYGLRVDGYVDERKDPEKSTDAALRYLQDLHNQFGSWYLAAAAYNSGENRVARVMREETGSEKGQEEDFWRIRRRLPAETREYVPLMLAAALIGKEPHKYGLGDVERYLPVPTEAVDVPGGTDLETVASSVGVSEKELRTLNPHLVKGMTPPGKKPYAVRIPEGRRAQFAVNFDVVRAKAQAEARVERERATRVAKAARARSSSKVHKVRSGESLWTIARRNDTSVAALKRANGLRSNKLKPGQRLRIPA